MEKNPSTRANGKIFFWNLARRNFVFHLRSNILFAAGCAVSAMILIGALGIGVSLRESIRGLHDLRLGNVKWVLNSSAGYFRESLADSISLHLSANAAPILQLTGSAGVAGGNERVHRVNIIGVDDRFWTLGGQGGVANYNNNYNYNDSDSDSDNDNGVDNFAIVNAALAEKLGVDSGSQIILRFQTAGSLVMDAPFGLQENTATLRLPVLSVVGREQFGDFSLRAEHFTVYNVFVPLRGLQEINGVGGRVATILIKSNSKILNSKSFYGDGALPRNAPIYRPLKNLLKQICNRAQCPPNPPQGRSLAGGITSKQIESVVQNSLSLRDAGLNIRAVDNDFEIYSDRIFISRGLQNVIIGVIPQAIPILGWFVNSIGTRELSTPYSFVSTPPIEYWLEGNQIALNGWTAVDLNASVGDTVTLTYFVPRQTSGLRLDTAAFVVSAINQDTAAWLNRSLMPPYPGLAGSNSCTDWNPSIPVDLSKIRPKDEEYWEVYEGTPKAIIGYAKAARIWENRFGASTAIRIPGNINDNINKIVGAGSARQNDNNAINIETAITPHLTLPLCGIQLTDVRSAINSAVNNGVNFAPLFAGLSFFTLAAALLLVWLLSALQVKSRAEEYKVLAAMGYSRRHILSIYLSEGLIVFSIGTIIGILLAPLYILAIIKALRTVWHAAAQVPELNLHIDMPAIIYGSAAAFVCALTAMLLPAFSLTKKPHGKIKRVRAQRTSVQTFNKRRFIILNILREKKRAIGETAILACALFVLGTTQLFHHNTLSDPALRSSGTGGFIWYGELNSGIPYEETTAQFLRERGVDIAADSAYFLSAAMRMRDGDDASCLNLNRAASPAILGVNQALFDSVGAFSFASMIDAADKKHPWRILGVTAGATTPEQRTGGGAYIYGIADANTIEWGLGKSLGDTLIYINEYGDTLGIILAAGLKNSILQGKIIIAESDFIRHFPSISGYRLLLLSTPQDKDDIIVNTFQSYHDRSGLQLESAADRLNAFNAVENTYLSIFALLGMMGLMIGCAGMGIIVARNISERRSELALLMAHGFTVAAIKRLLLSEHAAIAALGTLAGIVPALAVFFAYAGTVSASNIFRIAALIIIVLSCGIGSVIIGLRKLKKWDLARILKNDL